MSGRSARRFSLETASAFSFPDLTNGKVVETAVIMACTWPAITSVSAGPAPL
jgi:hypothetical protein